MSKCLHMHIHLSLSLSHTHKVEAGIKVLDICTVKDVGVSLLFTFIFK